MGGGGKPNNAPPPPMQKKRSPPHMEKMAWPPRTWREKTAHIKNTPIGETPPPPQMDFFIYASPIWQAPISPLVCADHDLHSLYSVCLRELEKKINKN